MSHESIRDIHVDGRRLSVRIVNGDDLVMSDAVGYVYEGQVLIAQHAPFVSAAAADDVVLSAVASVLRQGA